HNILFTKLVFPYFVLYRVCELLQSGAVMNKCYQPHEGHIPYLLQLFMDYNLYGMNLINMGAVKFRTIHIKGKISCLDLSLFS
ncbi:DNA polymerase zeta catalytic subunit, partial [Goodea atripinnis]